MADNLLLIGFMGAGKSSVGRVLANHRRYRCVDLDRNIEVLAGKTINQIFADEGEAHFRDLEEQALSQLLKEKHLVVATGGGIVMRPANWVIMRRLGRVVYLKAGWETLLHRLAGSIDRPLVNRATDESSLHALWQSRIPLYEQADLTIETDQLGPEAVAEEIVRRLQAL